jgi:hypothetical protein
VQLQLTDDQQRLLRTICEKQTDDTPPYCIPLGDKSAKVLVRHGLAEWIGFLLWPTDAGRAYVETLKQGRLF